MTTELALGVSILVSVVALGIIISLGNLSVTRAILSLAQNLRRSQAQAREERLAAELRAFEAQLQQDLAQETVTWPQVLADLLAQVYPGQGLTVPEVLRVAVTPVPTAWLRLSTGATLVLTTDVAALVQAQAAPRAAQATRREVDAQVAAAARITARCVWQQLAQIYAPQEAATLPAGWLRDAAWAVAYYTQK